jgi:hypothetical protein
MPYDNEQEEERARAERARTAGGALAPKPLPPPASAPQPNIGFTKSWSPAERAKQAEAYQKFLRDRGER